MAAVPTGMSGVADKNKIAKELEFLKFKMKEHFRFFDNHSPQLKKRKKAGSHSPPKKNSSNNKSFSK